MRVVHTIGSASIPIYDINMQLLFTAIGQQSGVKIQDQSGDQLWQKIDQWIRIQKVRWTPDEERRRRNQDRYWIINGAWRCEQTVGTFLVDWCCLAGLAGSGIGDTKLIGRSPVWCHYDADNEWAWQDSSQFMIAQTMPGDKGHLTSEG